MSYELRAKPISHNPLIPNPNPKSQIPNPNSQPPKKMSRGFVKEGDQEEIPMVLPRAFLPQGVPNYVTPEGLQLLHDEMDSLKQERVDAGSNYVLKNYIDAKMRLLSERINSAVMIDPSRANPDVVSFGLYVRYNDKVIRIVGVDEADVSKGLVSFISPIAKALIGKKKGDKFELKVPKGTELVEIQEVSVYINRTELRAKSSEQRLPEKKKPSASAVVDIQSELPIQNTLTTDFVEIEEARCSELMPQSQKTFVPETNPTDFIPMVNEQGNIVGRALYCEIHDGNKVLHPSVHLHVSDSHGVALAKYWWHVAFGETAEKTLKRKIKDVIKADLKPKFKKQYIRDSKSEKELVYVYSAVSDAEVLQSPDNKEYNSFFEKD